MNEYDLVVLGGGPAGLAAAVAAKENGARVMLIEREENLGGILKQCIHDGFGLVLFKERLTGTQYAERFLKKFYDLGIEHMTNAFLNSVQRLPEGGFEFVIQSAKGMVGLKSKTLVLACGCRERSARQVFIHGERPAGVFTAGTAQYLVNIMGQMPTKKCVILGSGDIGLIMARRLSLEGAQVEGVYEIQKSPAGLARNVSQCLDDFDIPLHLNSTVSKVFGQKRLEGVEVCKVDENYKPIKGSERFIECDALIVSVGLLPENEVAQSLGVEIDPATKGPYVDQELMTDIPGVFACGNALHVNDLVDYVSQSGHLAGQAAARYASGDENRIKVEYNSEDFLYVVPQYFDKNKEGEITLYWRSKADHRGKKVAIEVDGRAEKSKKYMRLLPSEMQSLTCTVKADVGQISLKMLDG
ncbi:MAG: FAD-dependent oxidoreductase [Clostridiales bacterium]|nr:FAD-dependent oxidoreductase [Clostridiales bacterium]